MATQNNLHIPDDLLSAVNEAASADGKTKDELAADALRRYLAHRKLEQLGKYGSEQSRRLGCTGGRGPPLIAGCPSFNRRTPAGESCPPGLGPPSIQLFACPLFSWAACGGHRPRCSPAGGD